MRLNEIFQEATLTPQGVDSLEKVLDKNYYQPAPAVAAEEPVLDMEISKSPTSHFIQRFNQRSEVAGFDLSDVARLLAKAKTDPALGYTDELNAASKEENVDKEIVIRASGKNPLTIPVMITPNPEVVKSQDNRAVGVTASGQKVPKNQIIPKTVWKQGIND